MGSQTIGHDLATEQQWHNSNKGVLNTVIVSILQIKKYVSWKENSSAQRHIDREWESWDLDSGQFPGLFNLPRYFEVEVKGKEFYRNTILTP